jgi:hypothetical protein
MDGFCIPQPHIIAVALLTVSYQTIRPVVNPVSKEFTGE